MVVGRREGGQDGNQIVIRTATPPQVHLRDA